MIITHKETHASNNKKTQTQRHIYKKTHSHTGFVAMTLLAGDNYKSSADLRVCEPK